MAVDSKDQGIWMARRVYLPDNPVVPLALSIPSWVVGGFAACSNPKSREIFLEFS